MKKGSFILLPWRQQSKRERKCLRLREMEVRVTNERCRKYQY
nr:MAG TPA: hypothetical protein [Caudoviricetes sp.]